MIFTKTKILSIDLVYRKKKSREVFTSNLEVDIFMDSILAFVLLNSF